jgi:hypothetical protein
MKEHFQLFIGPGGSEGVHYIDFLISKKAWSELSIRS